MTEGIIKKEELRVQGGARGRRGGGTERKGRSCSYGDGHDEAILHANFSCHSEGINERNVEKGERRGLRVERASDLPCPSPHPEGRTPLFRLEML